MKEIRSNTNSMVYGTGDVMNERPSRHSKSNGMKTHNLKQIDFRQIKEY